MSALELRAWPRRGPRGARAGLCIVASLVTAAPLGAQVFRVELVSGGTVARSSFVAKSQEVRICSRQPTGRRPCLTVPPGGEADCEAAGATVNCAFSGSVKISRVAEVSSLGEYELRAEVSRNQRVGMRSFMLYGPATLTASNPPRGRAGQSGSGRGLEIVTTLDLETYVTAVLAGEAGTSKRGAALEAMAVVARTWALGSGGRHAPEGFDFCSLTHCQVVRIPSATKDDFSPPWTDAVKKTEREVMEYRGHLAEAYFSADCGGRTEAAADLWPDRAEPYLVSLPDPYCGSSEHASWERRLPLPTAAKILGRDLGVRLGGPLDDLRVESRDASGRAKTLVATGQAPHRVNANDFRFAVNRKLGWDALLSNLYTIELSAGVLLFRGRGLGHGVGLCQAGAEEMARLGADYRKILNQYFPGTELRRLSKDPVLSSEHFELIFPASQQPWADETLKVLEREREALGPLAPELPGKVRVETWETTAEFIRETGRPGWMAAATDGRSVALQPLKKLHDKGILGSTLRHELAHLNVHRRRATGVPQWFEEGMVLFLAGEPPPPNALPWKRGQDLERTVVRPHSENEMKAAYAESLVRVQRLAREKGTEGLWRTLEHPSADDLAWFRNQE